MKTNAMRILEKYKIPYKVLEYSITDEEIANQESYGKTASSKLNISETQIFKTLITKSDKNIINVFCIPVNLKLDLKQAAKITNNKKLEMLPYKDILSTTGYMVGSCSPIGMKKLFKTYFDQSALCFEYIGISGGKKGVEILINANLIKEIINVSFVNLK